MNILFLTMARIYDISSHDIYQDLIRSFIDDGHNVYVVTPSERRNNLPTTVLEASGCKILRVKTGNQSSCGNIEKGISLITLRYYYIKAIQKHFKGIKFDLLLYTTPPITIMPIVKKFKKRYGCLTYLMLKDIFPQNAVDLGIMKKNSIVYRYFTAQEKKLYRYSDCIGCMSQANINYLASNNNIDGKIVELCPNAVEPVPYKPVSKEEKISIREKYNIPADKTLIIYGGNIGRPQGIPFLTECLKAAQTKNDFYFLIVGGGNEYVYLSGFLAVEKLSNTQLISTLPRTEYFKLVRASDAGLICLDERFSIPNFPSRLLPYMEYSLPVLCIVDDATDVGDVCADNGFGWKCSSGDVDGFLNSLDKIAQDDLNEMGIRSRRYLEENFNVSRCRDTILEKLNGAASEA